MGREAELWDDSSLIKAFDAAIFKYKKMHGKGSKEKSNGVSGDLKSSTDDSSAANEDDKILMETEKDGSTNAAHASVEVAVAEVKDTGDEVAASQVPESNLLIQDQAQNDSNSLAVEEYNQLYQQYYELEEQRQEILQKLQNLSGWSYMDGVETSGSGVRWDSTAAQGSQSSTSQLPCGATMVVSCCPCASPCSMPSCFSLPCRSPLACMPALCNDTSASTGLQKQPAVEDSDIAQMAMGTAERAMSALKDSTSDWKGDNKMCSGAEINTNPGTDLSTVLNAWYSAGFYTGKYLTEQSFAKKHDE